jgi:small subunit ribosomal protein S9
MTTNAVYAASGRRKESVARAILTPGKGTFVVNEKTVNDYLCRETLVETAKKPLTVVDLLGRMDIVCHCNGGGVSGQAGAISLAISRALLLYNPDYRVALRKEGLLTRDPRSVERKKYGRPKARKRFQYSKR